MLADVAGRLRHSTGESAMLSRIAGNEFICLLKDCSHDEVMQLGEQAQARISAFRLEVRPEQYAAVGLSFGIAQFPADGCSTDELLHAASLATRRNHSLNESQVASQPQTVAASYGQRGKSGPLALVR
jgi:diguanylate cyclase (GGDEF)-like protein